MAASSICDVFAPCAADREGGLTASVDYALSLAEAMDAHVSFRLMGQKFDPPYSLAPGFVASLSAPANAQEKKRLDAAEAALAARLAGGGVRHSAHAVQLSQDEAMTLAAHEARLHDLSIMDAPETYFSWGRALAEELLFQSGRPVIVVPAEAKTFSARRILVAWDGTAKAARALNDAMPLLTAAEHVEIVSVAGEKDLSALPKGTDVSTHLARHDVQVEVVGLDAAGRDPGAAIRERAELAGIDMVVMGAFAHSRWRQLVLGGVTDSMLSRTRTPLFLSA
jgi:nucleotide-binding universal stress UspA family protein